MQDSQNLWEQRRNTGSLKNFRQMGQMRELRYEWRMEEDWSWGLIGERLGNRCLRRVLCLRKND